MTCILTLICLIHLIPQIIAFDELKTDYKNPIDQCNTLNPVSGTTAADAPSLPLLLHAHMLCPGYSFIFRVTFSRYHFSALFC